MLCFIKRNLVIGTAANCGITASSGISGVSLQAPEQVTVWQSQFPHFFKWDFSPRSCRRKLETWPKGILENERTLCFKTPLFCSPIMVGVAWVTYLFLPVWYFIIKGKPFTATVDLQLQIYWSLAVFIYSFQVHIAWSKILPFYAQFSLEAQIIRFRSRECRNFTYRSIFSKHHCINQEIRRTAMMPCCGLLAISNVCEE